MKPESDALDLHHDHLALPEERARFELALAGSRELREELAIDVSVGRVWDVLFHAYPTFDLVMIVYPCRLTAGDPAPVEVAAFEWVVPAQLREWDVLPADKPLIARLELEGLPEN